MCDPTMLLLASSAVSGMGAFMGAQQQAAASEAQAEAAEVRAQQEHQAGAFKAARAGDQFARIGGQQRAAVAEGGLAQSGSAVDVADDTASEADLDIATILWNSNAAATNSRNAASIHRANAKSARRSAPISFLSPILGNAARFPSAFGFS